MTLYVRVKAMSSRKPVIERTSLTIDTQPRNAQDLITYIVRQTVPGDAAAVQNALTSFEDGLFRIFINDNEIEPDLPIVLRDEDEICFLRLTMLAGRIW